MLVRIVGEGSPVLIVCDSCLGAKSGILIFLAISTALSLYDIMGLTMLESMETTPEFDEAFPNFKTLIDLSIFGCVLNILTSIYPIHGLRSVLYCNNDSYAPHLRRIIPRRFERLPLHMQWEPP